MVEYALVLCGGGGRGAYQVGAWKALEENGIARRITAVSGASVGALNAALFASVTSEKAEHIWKSISQTVIADPAEAIGHAIGSVISFARSEDKAAQIGRALNSGIFSRQGLIDLIERNNINTLTAKARIPCFACCTEASSGKAEYFDMRALSPHTITSVLIASSAIPAAFPPEKIGDSTYRDGGLADNTPVKPLYDIGYRHFIISYLSEQTLDKSLFPNAEFIELIPSDAIYLGAKNTSLLNNGTMDFNAESAAARIHLGERETAKALVKIDI